LFAQIEAVVDCAAKADLPPGWALAKDDAGRVYYWHVKTKKVTWDVPTASTSIEP